MFKGCLRGVLGCLGGARSPLQHFRADLSDWALGNTVASKLRREPDIGCSGNKQWWSQNTSRWSRHQSPSSCNSPRYRLRQADDFEGMGKQIFFKGPKFTRFLDALGHRSLSLGQGTRRARRARRKRGSSNTWPGL